MWQSRTNFGLPPDMRQQQSSAATKALGITLALLGILAAIGLYSTDCQNTDKGLAIQSFFFYPTPKSPQYIETPPINIPEPTLQLAIQPILHLESDFAPEQEFERTELSEQSLPLIIETDIAHKQEVKKLSPPPSPETESAITPPLLLKAPTPDYPPTLKYSRRSGSVKLRIHIDTSGSPTQVEIISSTHPAFAQAARECILSRWRFSPALRNSTAIPSTAVQTINFNL